MVECGDQLTHSHLHVFHSFFPHSIFHFSPIMSDFSLMDLANIKEYFSQVFTEVQALVGPAVDQRCGICQNLASAHIESDITGCADKQMDEEPIKSSLVLQIKSAEDLLGRPRAVSSLGRQVSKLGDENDDLQEVVAEHENVMVRQKRRISDMQAAQDNLVGRVCSIWEKYHSGLIDYSAVLDALEKDFSYSLPISDFSHSSTPITHTATSTPMAPAPTSAAIPAASAAFPSASAALPTASAVFPATSTALPATSALHLGGIGTTTSGEDVDGEKVGKKHQDDKGRIPIQRFCDSASSEGTISSQRARSSLPQRQHKNENRHHHLTL